MSAEFVDVSAQEMEELLKRIEDAQKEGLSLEPEDICLVLQILRHFAFMQERLNDNDTLKQKYLKLLKVISSSEAQSELFDENKPLPKPKRKRRKPSVPPSKVAPAKVCHHKLEGLEKGQICPKCEKGKIYKFDSASFVRMVGSPPLTLEKHIMEQLRCNLCGTLYTAQLPEEVLEDGARQQAYGFTARAVMVINKFSMGTPYYRQESLQHLLGQSVSASSIYDQCRHVYDNVLPLITCMTALASDAVHYHIDDTNNKIIEQEPIEKDNRNGKGTRMRTGVYTSGMIATLDDGTDIVLFQTNIGHAGEFIDEVLSQRNPSLPKPTLMSDALASNEPQKSDADLSLCNAHSRRKFIDVVKNHPVEVEHIVENYALIWQNETHAKEEGLSPQQRTAYHKEHSLPVMEALKTWINEKLAKKEFEENTGFGRAAKYFIKHYIGLALFCFVVGAKLDNNKMEMTLKLIALNRKNSYFYRTLDGAKVGDSMASLIATCELNGVNIFDYLVAVQKHSLAVGRQPERWMPWNYLLAVEEITLGVA